MITNAKNLGLTIDCSMFDVETIAILSYMNAELSKRKETKGAKHGR